jgi:hypothetical protein
LDRIDHRRSHRPAAVNDHDHDCAAGFHHHRCRPDHDRRRHDHHDRDIAANRRSCCVADDDDRKRLVRSAGLRILWRLRWLACVDRVIGVVDVRRLGAGRLDPRTNDRARGPTAGDPLISPEPDG